jgi:hypothetical protein
MTNYARMYRWGITPWERYGRAAAGSITAVLDRKEAQRSRPQGRALDLGAAVALQRGAWLRQVQVAVAAAELGGGLDQAGGVPVQAWGLPESSRLTRQPGTG